MKKLILFSLLVSFYGYTQNYKVGDTIYLNKKVPSKKSEASTYLIVKKDTLVNYKKLYKMVSYNLKKDSSAFYKRSIYYTIDPLLSNSYHKHISFFENGNKSAEGYGSRSENYGKWTHWYENGQKKDVQIFFKNKKKLTKKGKAPKMIAFWDKNGNQLIKNGNGAYRYTRDSTEIKGFYRKGKKHGKFTSHVNNRKRYEEFYKKGKLLEGKSWDKKGKEYTYTETFVTPKFPKGQKGIAEHIKNNFVIPQYAYDNNIAGRIILTFKINKDSSISDIKIIKKVCEPCDQEAIRVIKLMKNWTPGISRGQKVRVGYTIPITYNL